MKVKLTKNYYWDDMNYLLKFIYKILTFPITFLIITGLGKAMRFYPIGLLVWWNTILVSQIFPIEDYCEG